MRESLDACDAARSSASTKSATSGSTDAAAATAAARPTTTRSGIDAVSARALTGHLTQQMQDHYSSVQLDDKRAVIARLDEHLRSVKVEDQVEGRPQKEKGRNLSSEKAA